MRAIKTTKPQLRCAKCGYEWQQRGERAPKECPQCKSRYWQEKVEKE